ncbi:hypothetical protein GC163_05060 [bacterium]|nr:hypothetical protein [bacterium]
MIATEQKSTFRKNRLVEYSPHDMDSFDAGNSEESRHREHELVSEARRLTEILRDAEHRELRWLSCRVSDNRVDIHGNAGSYFVKQMAQEVVKKHMRRSHQIRNLVQVIRPDKLPA